MGAVVVRNNQQLCHMDTVDWVDLFSRKDDFKRSTFNLRNKPSHACERLLRLLSVV
jgi:hypothetical protein